MDTTVLLQSLSAHMDLLASYHTLMITTAIATIYAAFSQDETVKLHFFEMPRVTAAKWLSIFFILIGGGVFVTLLRLYALLEWLPSEAVSQAVSAIGTHVWLLNPFTSFGNSPLNQTILNVAVVTLVVTWWIGFYATSVLPQSSRRVGMGLSITFCIESYFILVALRFVSDLLAKLMTGINFQLGEQPIIVWTDRIQIIGWTSVFAFIGILVLSVTPYLYKRGFRSERLRQVMVAQPAAAVGQLRDSLALRRRK